MARPALALALGASLCAFPAHAGTPLASWLDLLSPDHVATLLLQGGITAIRSQAEISYDALSVDVAGGTVAITGLSGAPLPAAGVDAACRFGADRLAVSGLSPAAGGLGRLRIEAAGLAVAAACMDREPREALAAVGLEALRLDRLAASFDYRFGPGAADVGVQLSVPGIADLEATLVLDYLALAEPGTGPDPVPVARLRSGAVTVEDRGLLARLRPLLPPEMADPAAAARGLAAELARSLERENRAAERRARIARGESADAPFEAPLTAAQQAFVASFEREVARFLGQGGTVALATAVAGPAVLIDPAALDGDPRPLFDALAPTFAAGPPARAGILPAALVGRAITVPGGLSEEERRRVGLAFLSGRGVPRDLDRGVALLAPLAGEAAVAQALAEALAGRDPGTAYGHALAAAAARAPGALALLDRIEAGLDPAVMLAAQAARAEAGAGDEAVFASVAALRAAAQARMMGTAVPRSYPQAWYLASLAAAAGDAAGAAIRDEIEARMAARGPAGAAAWAAATAPLAGVILRDWLARDLPRQFGGG